MIRTIIGDCRSILPTLPADSVHCVVTSPPYWGLRDYGVSGQLGLEPSIAEFIAEMVAVFREVKRVLRPDGTLWLNLGSSYASGGTNLATASLNIKAKDEINAPHLIAMALQADGWVLRQTIVWFKRNPMPESVTDRCTQAHEYLFLLTKSARYYFDGDAIREPHADWREGHNTAKPQDQSGIRKWNPGANEYNPAGRNKRSVWEIATHAYSEAHFATFPPALVEPCIKAGTSEKGYCAKCGAPWERKVDSETIGWQPTCLCYADLYKARKELVPATILDPFAGAGTTGLVADRLQRNAILIELSPKYAEMAKSRIYDDAPLFAGAVE